FHSPHARSVSGGIPFPQTAERVERKRVRRLLPGGDRGEHRPAAGDEVLSLALACVSEFALRGGKGSERCHPLGRRWAALDLPLINGKINHGNRNPLGN